MLRELKNCGIRTYADLRAKNSPDDFPLACEDAGIEYLHLPTDKFRTPDRVIISNIFLLAKLFEDGDFYISCQLGLHRTDMALSLHYIFNPTADEPPILNAPLQDGKIRYRDIFLRAGSVYRSLTEEDKELLGWDVSFENEYINRKKTLRVYQRPIVSIF